MPLIPYRNIDHNTNQGEKGSAESSQAREMLALTT